MLTAALAALLFQAAPPNEIDPKRVKDLVDKLNADDLAERTQAEADLVALGEGVVPLLEKSKPGAPAEARARIDAVIADLTLAQRWVKDLSEETDPSNAYRRLETAITSKSLDRKQAVKVLGAVLLSDTNDQLKQYVYALIERHKFRETWPALVQLAARDENEGRNAISYLQRLRPPKEATDEILKLLPKIRNRSNSYQMFELLFALKPEKAKLDAALEAFLDGDTADEMRTHVLSYISQGRLSVSLKMVLKFWKVNRSQQSYSREAVLRTPPDESVGEIIALFASSETEDLMMAADYVARHRVKAAGAAIAEALQKYAEERPPGTPVVYYAGRPYWQDHQIRGKLIQALRGLGLEDQVRQWLASSGPPSRPAAVALIGELEIRGLAGEVVKLLEDKDPLVRREAARAASGLRLAEAVPKLEARLKDESIPVRRSSLSALAKIRGTAATATVLEQLRADHPDVQAAAVELLPSMDLEAVLNELTKEANLGNSFMRYALAVVISSQGETALHRVMARAGGKLSIDDFQGMVRLIQATRGR